MRIGIISAIDHATDYDCVLCLTGIYCCYLCMYAAELSIVELHF